VYKDKRQMAFVPNEMAKKFVFLMKTAFYCNNTHQKALPLRPQTNVKNK